MPLFKRKPFTLAKPPEDLEPHELIYQVRFTKEIFRDYQAYLNRINLYRQRVWTCKSTGKTNLTYEEALVSEKHANERVQELPNELLAPALQTIQYSMLSLRDLADTIAKKLQQHYYVGAELYGRKDGNLCPCKVLQVLECDDKTQYQIAWLDRNRKIKGNAVLHGKDLVWKKAPFSRNFLKSFIRESTFRSIPWVLHEKLAQENGISTDRPEELKSKFFFQNGKLVSIKKKRKNEVNKDNGKVKRVKVEEDDAPNEEVIRYPIDDLLVCPGPDDPVFTDRPLPSRDFNVPMDCVGDLLMVWDFCSSFSRQLHLWPFSLEDFESAICHKDSNLTLISETHSVLFRLLIKDNGEYSLTVQKRKRKPKISLINWSEYLCDFMEMVNIPEFSSNMTTIKRGHYGLLDVNVKLGILQELVNQALETNLFRAKLDEHIEQRQMLGATRRGEALEEGRKKREEKERLKGGSHAHGLMNGHDLENTESHLLISADDNHSRENGLVTSKKNGAISSQQNNSLDISESKQVESALMKTDKRQNMDTEVNVDSCGKEALKQFRTDKKGSGEKKSKEQRREYFEREIEKRSIRSSPLGKDRDYNRYWWFRRDGRIFVESADSKNWGYYCSKEELDALMGSLNCKGERERALHKQLEKFYGKICLELHKRSKDAQRMALEESVLRRSTRVRAPPKENPASAFFRYVNKWKED